MIREDYIRTARAKGLKEQMVINRHALRNGLIPVVTVIGPLFAGLVTGTFVIELVFGTPRLGKYFVTSITNRDYPVIMGTILLYVVFLVIVNLIIMRIVDVFHAFPGLLFIILLRAFFLTTIALPEEGTFSYYIGLPDAKFGGLKSWETQARLTRGQVLSTREQEYIVVARTIVARDRPIMFRHILRNITGPLIVVETLAIPAYIHTEAFLSFIGCEVNPPTPSCGSMIATGSRALRSYPNQALFPALAPAIPMFAFNFLGDGLRDALEPRLRGIQE